MVTAPVFPFQSTTQPVRLLPHNVPSKTLAVTSFRVTQAMHDVLCSVISACTVAHLDSASSAMHDPPPWPGRTIASHSYTLCPCLHPSIYLESQTPSPERPSGLSGPLLVTVLVGGQDDTPARLACPDKHT